MLLREIRTHAALCGVKIANELWTWKRLDEVGTELMKIGFKEKFVRCEVEKLRECGVDEYGGLRLGEDLVAGIIKDVLRLEQGEDYEGSRPS